MEGKTTDNRLEPDELLAERASQAPEGDTRAFEALVERYKEKVVANCRFLTRSPDDAEDLAQEVFVKVFFGLPRFERRSKFRTWLYRIKVNQSLNHIRKQKGTSFVDVEAPHVQGIEELTVEPVAETKLEGAAERKRISRILDRMSDTLRIPLILRDMDKMSYEEIAKLLGLGLSAVKMRIKRAREEFRRRYEQKPGPAGGIQGTERELRAE